MSKRWSLSRRELAAWAAIILLVSILGWSIRPAYPEPDAVRIVREDAVHAIPDSPAVLDLNQASEQELQLLPGIGEQRARQIVVFRRAHGGFRSVDQLTDLPGFSRALVDRLAPLLTVTPVNGERP